MPDENSKQLPTVAPRRKPPAAGKGRPKGALNKTTRTLKAAILAAAEAHGEDGQGAGGLHGYLVRIAQTEPVAFCALLRAVLPKEDESPAAVVIYVSPDAVRL